MNSTLDNLLRFGQVEVKREDPEEHTSVIVATLNTYPFMADLPVTLVDSGVDADIATMNLWNQLVSTLPLGWGYNKEVSR